jgi:hypothetical protein
MNRLLSTSRQALLTLAFTLPLLSLAPAAQAAEVTLFFSGSGNVLTPDPATGEGGWVGSINEFPEAGLVNPVALTSTVLFTYDAALNSFTGTFEFFDSATLTSSLFGTVMGESADPDPFVNGGQFGLMYDITGGSGLYAGATGFGLSFLEFNPDGGFGGPVFGFSDTYGEDGLLFFNVPTAVPEPGTLPLMALALAALWVGRRTPASRA